MRNFTQLAIALVLVATLGCTGNRTGNQDSLNNTQNSATVTVSILPLKYFVEKIAGETVNISVLVQPGCSPEMFEPQPATLVEFSKSDLYFAVGLIDFEKGLEQKLLDGRTKFVNLSANADLIEGSCDHHHGCNEHHHEQGVDPHIWTSCKEAKRMASIIAAELSNTYKQNASIYANNLLNLYAAIDSVDLQVKTILTSSSCKHFLIYHPSLGYFARDYGLTQVSIENEGKDPSAQGIVATVNAARAAGITTILAQSQFDKKNAMAIAAELGGDVVEVDPLAPNWPAQMVHIAKAITSTK